MPTDVTVNDIERITTEMLSITGEFDYNKFFRDNGLSFATLAPVLATIRDGHMRDSAVNGEDNATLATILTAFSLGWAAGRQLGGRDAIAE